MTDNVGVMIVISRIASQHIHQSECLECRVEQQMRLIILLNYASPCLLEYFRVSYYNLWGLILNGVAHLEITTDCRGNWLRVQADYVTMNFPDATFALDDEIGPTTRLEQADTQVSMLLVS